ncbi:unnamed protein product [Rhizoctonia solani]|uniref:Uncharacterized protein n=1 Tax=Rhizoctonia solani TaxID=456999 RepID=A0A8H3BVS1_9AGAM|nr:unnamed protein product [Rhizoctonia solani]
MSHYPCNETNCIACQARGTGNWHTQLYSEGESYTAAEASHSEPELTIRISGTETGPTDQIISSTESQVDTPAQRYQHECEERTLAIGDSTWTERNLNLYYHPPNYPQLSDNDPNHLMLCLRATQKLSSSPCNNHDQPSCGESYARNSVSPARLRLASESTPSLDEPDGLIDQISKISHSTGLMKPPDPDANLGDPDDPENVRGEIVGFLWLDRHVESNGLPFILQAYATWISRFLFEPLRVIQIARHEVFRLYATGEESRRMMHLIAGSVYEITRSTDYNPIKSPSFATLQVVLRNRFIGARTRVETSHKWDRQYALGVMLSISEFTFALSKVMSLSTALGFMQLVAPVFRLACPHPLDELINLPTLFTTKIVPLQYYSTLDVLLGVLTSRPMFFRYDVKFTPEAPELIFQLEDGPGIRWCDGIPDQIVLIFAQMNSLYEDFGPRVRKDVADKLEAEIKRMRPIEEQWSKNAGS